MVHVLIIRVLPTL